MKFMVGVICALVGIIIGQYLLAGTAAVYASMLISFHLYLGYLVVTENREKGLSLPIGSTLLTHAACLIILIGLVELRHHLTFFWLIQYFVPALAPFEAEWLFSGGRKKPGFEASVPQIPMPQCTADDYDEFLKYLSQEKRAFRKPGRSVREEHVLWMADRVKKEAAAAVAAQAAAAAAAARQRSAEPAPR
ncbi:MAG TPA: hypothetical protein VMD55_03700 [Terracidiphilus sp.]|jgi:hypothetical protein|nr:hypothetical protein [Terracidiphilus sp.]